MARHLLSAFHEERCADADIRGTESDGLLEIGAHAHAEVGKSVALRQFFQKGKMRRRRLIDGRDAHRAAYIETGLAAMIEKAGNPSGVTPPFCSSSPVLT
jgi:hypothetical protein